MTNLILFLHIAAGFAALGAAGVALAAAKGATTHRRAGAVYVLAMLAVTLTNSGLVVIRPKLFLFVISVFSFYLAGVTFTPSEMIGPIAGLAVLGLGGARFWEGMAGDDREWVSDTKAYGGRTSALQIRAWQSSLQS